MLVLLLLLLVLVLTFLLVLELVTVMAMMTTATVLKHWISEPFGVVVCQGSYYWNIGFWWILRLIIILRLLGGNSTG